VLAIAATMATQSATVVGISGRAELTYTDQHAATVPDAPGHLLLVGEARGTKTSDDQAYFPNAQVVNVDHADLKQGSGPTGGTTPCPSGGTRLWSLEGAGTTTMNRDEPEAAPGAKTACSADTPTSPPIASQSSIVSAHTVALARRC
jgi:hypothetical protein